MTRMAYHLRGVLIAPLFIFALLCFSYETESDWVIWSGGVSIFILGLLLRIWAQQHLHYRLHVKKHFTDTGPYSFVRNPIYLGNILLCLGCIIVSELLWLTPIAFFYCFGIYSLVVRYEEGHLLEKYGEPYRRFMWKVPRWFPKTLSFKDLEIKNEYLRATMFAEIQCGLLLVPFLAKELLLGIF
jgi:protein-S-isoprenylcysteine O-methyltransferase Ste14